MTETFDKIKDIIVETLEIDPASITPETNIQGDLGVDSLDLFQVINDIEDTFDIEIDTEEGFQTVGELVAYVDAHK